MITLRLWPILLLLGWTLFSSGSASAQVTAREDSLAQAFLLLKLDYETQAAKYKAEAAVDSLRIDLVNQRWQSQLDAERELRNKLLLTMLVAAAVSGTLIYLGTLAD